MNPPADKTVSPRPKRSIIYIDGFNLYYGVLKGTPHKWLDLERYFRLLLSGHDIEKIRYFTARIVGPGVADQDVYLSALETLPLVEIVLGQFKKKQIQGLCPTCPLTSPQFLRMRKNALMSTSRCGCSMMHKKTCATDSF